MEFAENSSKALDALEKRKKNENKVKPEYKPKYKR